MARKLLPYYITPVGVLSFTRKYVFINGLKTTSTLRIINLLQSLNKDLFSYKLLFLFGVNSYDDLKWTLYRYIRENDFGELDTASFRVTCISDSFVHKASDIFHGQYCDFPPKSDNNKWF